MPKNNDLEHPSTEIAYTVDATEVTGLDTTVGDDTNKDDHGLWGKLVRLLSNASAEEHDKGRALRRAVRAQDIDAVRAMIAKGYGVNEAQEASLACIAARRTNIEMLRLLVEAGVDINRPDRRSQTSKARTPLQEASRKGWREGVEFLLELGASVDDCEDGDVTALHIAARAGYPDVVKLLLMNRADAYGARLSPTTPLHEVSDVKIAKMLLEAGARVNEKDRNKCTPLHLQCYYGREDIVELLLKAQADVHSFDRKGRPPLFLLGSRGNCVKIYEMLSAAGANFTSKDLSDNNVAHSLAQRANDDTLLKKLFEEHPELFREKNISNQTPIDILQGRNRNELASYFDRRC